MEATDVNKIMESSLDMFLWLSLWDKFLVIDDLKASI